jgi:hypothetical protein
MDDGSAGAAGSGSSKNQEGLPREMLNKLIPFVLSLSKDLFSAFLVPTRHVTAIKLRKFI